MTPLFYVNGWTVVPPTEMWKLVRKTGVSVLFCFVFWVWGKGGDSRVPH